MHCAAPSESAASLFKSKSDISLSKILPLIIDKAITGEFGEIIVGIIV
jgi:hypothetical protein